MIIVTSPKVLMFKDVQRTPQLFLPPGKWRVHRTDLRGVRLSVGASLDGLAEARGSSPELTPEIFGR